ncbi:MAG: Htur_1727 family rSAM-partnered candidate RiPP [Halobaculum sp.]
MDDEWQPVTAPRADGDTREWEVFCRLDAIRHVGSVSAPSLAVAREEATTLFGDATDTLWLCPADACHRFTTRSFAESAADDEPAGDASRADAVSDTNETSETDAVSDTNETSETDAVSDTNETSETDAKSTMDEATDGAEGVRPE